MEADKLPFAGYKDFADCVAKNSDKKDPDAYCAVIKRQVEGESVRRHPDFNKIYHQFLKYDNGEFRYYKWINALNLDETRQYGDSRKERFAWTRRHVDFDLWKEDTQAKYWQVEAGFPLESMNFNVYSTEELQESARTLSHKEVNLNHKYSLPTVDIPAAKYEDGLVEAILRVPKSLRCPICSNSKTVNDLISTGGIVNVSLEAVCTLQSDDPHKCEGMEFTGLSLLTKDTLPGIPLTRLMPLESIMVEALQVSTREKPKMKKRKIRVKAKVKEQAPRTDAERAKAHFNLSDEEWNKLSDEQKNNYISKLPPRGSTEQNQPDPHCSEGEHYDVTQHKCVPDSAPAEYPETLEQSGTQTTVVQPVKPTTVKPDEHGQCPEGWKLSTIVGTGEEPHCVPMTDEEKQQQVEGSVEPDLASTQVGTPAVGDGVVMTSGPELAHKGPPTGSMKETTYSGEPAAVKDLPEIITRGDEVPPHMHDEPMTTSGPLGEQPMEPQTAKSKPGDRHLDMPEGDTSMHPTAPATKEPKPPHTCPDGQHWSDADNACMPDSDLTETVRRFKAEYALDKARKDTKFIEAVWAEKYTKLDKEYRSYLQRAQSRINQQKGMIKTLTTQNNRLTRELVEAQTERDTWRRRRDEVAGTRDDLQRQLEKLHGVYEDRCREYNSLLKNASDCEKKSTKYLEDWIALSQEYDILKEKLGKARVMAKKTLKLKA